MLMELPLAKYSLGTDDKYLNGMNNIQAFTGLEACIIIMFFYEKVLSERSKRPF